MLIFILIAVALAVLPVMLAARAVGAGRQGFGAAFVAVLLQGLMSGLTQEFVESPGVAVLVAIVLGSAIYALVLDTSWLKGFLIGVLSVVIAIVAALALGTVFNLAGGAILI